MKKIHLLSTLFTLSLVAEGPRLNLDSAVVFAGIDEAQRVLTHRDDFIAALSKFDRAARMKTDQEATEAEFLGFVHPDEILAENFVRLLNGETNVPSPKVIEDMSSILRHQVTSLPARGAEPQQERTSRPNR